MSSIIHITKSAVVRYILVVVTVCCALRVEGQHCNCTFTVPEFANEMDGGKWNVQAGDTICLDAAITYGHLKFSYIVGTPEEPIVIINCGGRAKINSFGQFGVKFVNSKYFKFLGNGVDTLTHGIEITTRKGFFLTMEHFTSNFEIANIEIAGPPATDTIVNEAFAGIGVKTKPYCDGTANRGVWTMYDVMIHDTYIHDVGGEGMYIGHGFYNGRVESGCKDTTYSHSIEGVKIYNNRIENTGYDGIQVKNADKDCEIHHNHVKNYGLKNDPVQNEGIFIGEGTTGKVYNNWIEKGSGNGIQFQGSGNNDFFNNVVIDSKENGFYAAGGKYVHQFPGSYVRIYNNTFIRSANYGFLFYNYENVHKTLINNIFIGSVKGFTKKGALVTMSNNLHNLTASEMKFKNYSKNNFHLSAASPAVNTGVTISEIKITFDYDDHARPVQGKLDVGAFEFIPNK